MDAISLRMMQLAGAGYCCSQILLALALETRGEHNPGLVRAMAGLCVGLGDCSGDCGVLLGGSCLLAYYCGKGDDTEEPHDSLPLLLESLREWFRGTACAQYGSIVCADILGEEGCGSPNSERCGQLVSATYSKCMELLLESGIDPSLHYESSHA